MNTDKLPKEWIKTKLGTLIELKYGKSLAAHSRDGIGFDVFGSNGIVGKHSKALVNNAGLIIGRKGSFGVVNKSSSPFFPIDTTYYVDEFYKQPINFWFYYLTFLPLTKLNRSTAIPGLNRDDAYALDIILPSLAEQKIIADKLDDLLACMESIKTRLEKILGILKKFRQSVLIAAVSGRLTEDWRNNNSSEEWKELQLIDVIESKPRNGHSPKGVDYKTPIKNLTLSAITKGYFSEGCFKYVDIEVPKKSHLWLKKNDILIQRANSIDYVGISAIYRGADDKYIYPDLIMKVRANNRIITEYLHYCLLSEDTREYFRRNASGTTGNMPKINQGTVSTVPLKLPSLPEQIEIVRRAENIFNFSESIERLTGNALSQINNLTQSIIAKAFRGELTAQWREENPELISGINSAEALLERIAEEKLASGNTKRSAKKAVN
ncbi:TPA: restriction endonuclease subunit S [Klebsiella quasipneumoniae]